MENPKNIFPRLLIWKSDKQTLRKELQFLQRDNIFLQKRIISPEYQWYYSKNQTLNPTKH